MSSISGYAINVLAPSCTILKNIGSAVTKSNIENPVSLIVFNCFYFYWLDAGKLMKK